MKYYYPLIIAPVLILSRQISNLWQVPWWAGLRLAAAALLLSIILLSLLIKPVNTFNTRHPLIARLLELTFRSMLIFQLAAIGITGIIRDAKPQETPRGMQAGPDVYFIVLDSYTASETLLTLYSYDNSWFLEELRSLGFQAGSCESNYAYTGPSLGAILNGEETAPTQTWLNWRLVQRALLRTTLEERGYDTIAFATGFDWNEPRDAAYFLEPELDGPTDFEMYVMGDHFGDLKSEHFRERTATVLDNLDMAAGLPGSQFTYAHITQPHPPFVFQADGSPQDDRELLNSHYNGNEKVSTAYTMSNYSSGYTAQVEYISRAILPKLSTIVQQDPQALIILLGDHGPWYAPEYDQTTLCATYGDLPLDPTEAVIKITQPAD